MTAGSKPTDDLAWDTRNRVAIQDLLYEYCEKVDALDAEGLAGIFADDGELDFGHGRVVRGQRAVIDLMGERLAADFAQTSHHMSNIRIRFVDGEHAESRSYVMTWHWMKADRSERRFYGRYYDQLLLTPAGWRIQVRKLRMAGGVGYPDPPPFELIERRGR